MGYIIFGSRLGLLNQKFYIGVGLVKNGRDDEGGISSLVVESELIRTSENQIEVRK